MECPKSEWIVKRNYFVVKVVDNFENLFLQQMDDDPTDDDINFINRLISIRSFSVYQFPSFLSGQSDDDADYFERFDDNRVLKRNMFTIIEDA
jgi:hypothetical protein